MAFGDVLWTACFSGYRGSKFTFPLDKANVRLDALKHTLDQAVLSAFNDGYSIFYCGGAWGFDILAGETVLALRELHPQIRLRLALPFPEQDRRWPSGWKSRLIRLKETADEITEISPVYTKSCYQERNRFMVDCSSLLICYYDGQPGGTSYTVRYAMDKGVRVVNLYD